MGASSKRKVLLIGWDAADWKVIKPLMEAGRMPNVRRLVEKGVSGQIATLHPPLSPMLWTSIATGKRPFKHGIHGFSEPTPDAAGIRPVTNLSRCSKALWNILSQNSLRSAVVGWWPSHPAEPIRGVMVSDHFHRASRPFDEGWPLMTGAVHPPELADTLAALRIHPDLLTPAMVEPFVPRAREIDQDNDKRLALLLRTLAECMSIHAAAMWLAGNQPWDFFAVYYDAIDHFCHGFMKYHPPRQPWIGEHDFGIYCDVVSMAYQFHDRMLGDLVERAGESATVILMSDHGFHPDHLRPSSIPDVPAGPAIEHRDFGILAIGGPGIKQGESLYGASVLDVAPTLLALYGLPVGEDMDGKVLARAFVDTPDVALIPSWEDVPGADGCHPPHTRLDPVAAHEALEQMIALGYIERPDENRAAAVQKTIRELRYNLGEAYQDAGRHLEAHEIFTELRAADADEQRFAIRLFVSCEALGMTDEMGRIVADLDGRRRALFEEAKTNIDALTLKDADKRLNDNRLDDDNRREFARWRELARFSPMVVDYLKARILVSGKRYEDALAIFGRIPQVAQRPDLLLNVADLYRQLSRWRDAQQVYEEVLTIDPDNPQAHLGVCRAALRKRNFGVAAHSALDALQSIHQNPLAHFLLGLALAGSKDYARAAEAFRAAISFNPNFPEAHLRLAGLLEKHLNDAPAAREHLRLARLMWRRGTVSLPGAIERPAAHRTEKSSVPASEYHDGDAPQPGESVVIVSGLPRSGTSMLMQMLAAGGMSILSDGLREADESNPRGYFEFGPVKNLRRDSKWLAEAGGKAVKLVAPLLTALPAELACRIILMERDIDEVLDSQERMLGFQPLAASPKRRRMLREEYERTLESLKAMLARRPGTQLLIVEHARAVSEPYATAQRVGRFLGGGLDLQKMAAAIEPALHRVHYPAICAAPVS